MQARAVTIPSDIQYSLFSAVFLMLCPLLSVPFIFYGIYRQEKGAYALLALLLGILAYVSAPSEDLYRHYCLFTHLSVRPLSAVNWIEISLNGILPYLYWAMSHAGISFSWLRFFELTVGFYLLCCVFDFMMSHAAKVYTDKERFARFLIFFLFFDFLYTTMGVKFGFALCTYIYGLHLAMNCRRKMLGFCFFLITCVWHLSFVFTGPMVYAIYRFKPKKSTAVWGSIVLAVITPIFINFAGSYLFGRRFDFYFSKKADDVASYSAMTLPGLILYILPKLTVIPFAIILMKHYTTDSRWCRIALGWFALAVIMMFNAVTFYRFWWAFMALGPMVLFDLERTITFSRKAILGLIVSGLLFTAFNSLAYHKEIIYSPYYRAFYPAPLIVATDYDKKWVFNHIGHEGDFK